MGLWEQALNVDCRETFIQFMSALVADWKQRHELISRDDGAHVRIKGTPWKNCDCPNFLEAMQRWIADAAQRPSGISYRQLAQTMAAAAGFEPLGLGLASRQAERLNCWEFKKCGREPGGDKVSELGVCPAAVWDQRQGVNGGKNGGRVCWVLVGTLCGGKVQGVFADKIGNCAECEFYQYVCQGEGNNVRYALPRQKVSS